MTKKSPAERIEQAASALECATVDLIMAADHFSTTGFSIYDHRNRRRDLLSAARQYGTAMRRVAKLRG